MTLPLPLSVDGDRGDTINSIKQASEFGIVEGGQKLAGLADKSRLSAICPLSGVKRTGCPRSKLSAFGPERTRHSQRRRSAKIAGLAHNGSLKVSRGPLNEWCRTCANLVRTADINVRSLPMARWIQLPLSL